MSGRELNLRLRRVNIVRKEYSRFARKKSCHEPSIELKYAAIGSKYQRHLEAWVLLSFQHSLDCACYLCD